MATRHRILTWRMVVAALLVGVVLAVVSVPVGVVTTTLLPRQGGTFDRAYFLPAEDHDAWVYTVRNILHVHWQTSLVPKGVVDPPVGEEFERSGGDPRPATGLRP